MPLKLEEPRQGRSANYRIRGTYLGVRVDRSAGTPDKAVARKLLLKIKADIERGELSGRQELTFAAAALSYINAGGEQRFLKPIVDHFGPRQLTRDVDQATIDACAVAIYPGATPATRNRQVYSPISAILRHAGVRLEIRRPKGSRGRMLTDWRTPAEMKAAITAARTIDAEFAAFLVTLLYTGMRLSEALNMTWAHVDLSAATALIPKTKTDEPRLVHLPPVLVAELANLKARSEPMKLKLGKAETLDQIARREARSKRVFRFRKAGRLYQLLNRTSEASGVELGFHLMRHTWATWMRKFGGLSREDLKDTGAWSDVASIRRYDHVEVTEVAMRANLLPDLNAPIGAGSAVRKKKGRATA